MVKAFLSNSQIAYIPSPHHIHKLCSLSWFCIEYDTQNWRAGEVILKKFKRELIGKGYSNLEFKGREYGADKHSSH